jgi:hypothetical protein
MRPRVPRPMTLPLATTLGVILAMMAWPMRPDSARLPTEPARRAELSASAAHFDARAKPNSSGDRTAAIARQSAALWRRLMLERELELRVGRTSAFPSICELRPRPEAAAGEPLEVEAVEASAPAVRVLGRGNVAGVWEGATVPLESLAARSRWLTPAVGRVRAELSDGTSFEGRLHSIGEGKVWIENELGRMALLGSQIRSLRQLPPLVEPSSQTELPELPLVRVRTPGGIFQGRLLRREAGHVTLLTPEGGQVTLDDAEVETVPAGARVRRP